MNPSAPCGHYKTAAAPRMGPAHGLEASLEVLVVVAVDYWVDTGVGESQPMCKREHVAREQLKLLLFQTSVVRQKHEDP